MDMEQYIEIFIEESKEHLQSLNETLLELEKNPNDMDMLNEVFRVAHTLKGMAGTMGYQKMQNLTHDMENVLSEIRNGKIQVNSQLLDVLFKCLDALENYVDVITEKGNEGDAVYTEIIEALNSISSKNTESGTAKKQSNVTNTAQSKTNTDDTYIRKHLKLQFNVYEKEIALKALQENYNLFGITFYIAKGCQLKAARSFVIFNTLDELGDVIKTFPKVQDIEEEKFDLDFSVYLLTKKKMDDINDHLSKISEVDKVLVDQLTKDFFENKPKQKSKDNSKQIQKDTPKKERAKANKTVRVGIDRLDTLMNLVSELIIVKNGLENIDGLKVNNNFNESIEYLERITTNLHDAVMKVRMVPIEQVFNRFPRMIRDLSRKLNKKMELHMSGKETELDRTVIDEIGDPLVHLLRNAADHGLESESERINNGKSSEGHIFLKAFQDGNNVIIEVKDDGKGINTEKIKEKAINNGVVSAEDAENMSKQQVMDLLFKPSFSTSEKITDISGRGVGLDVVKTKIQALGGNIEIKSELNVGSTFIIQLPLTLAMIQALMINLSDEKYAIPLNVIQTIENIPKKKIKLIQNNEVVVLRDKVIPIIRLNEVLEVENKINDNDNMTIVVVKKGQKLAGLVVDDLLGQQEIVIKSLGKYLRNVKMIAGATILGDGEVALILDINSLI